MEIIRNIRYKIIIVLFIGVLGCKEDTVPGITTKDITAITATSATGGGIITDEGSGTIISRGVCWSTNIDPSISDDKTVDGAGAGGFSSNLTGLKGGRVYYVKAYATNIAGTGYGMAMAFTTLGQIPTATTLDASNIQATSAKLNGTVSANQLSTSVSFEYGTTTSYGQTVTATQSPLAGTINTAVNVTITGLTYSTTYNFRVKAVNDLGTTYGNNLTFKNNCMSCKNVTYENGVVINFGPALVYCGADLEAKLATPNYTLGTLTTKVECSAL